MKIITKDLQILDLVDLVYLKKAVIQFHLATEFTLGVAHTHTHTKKKILIRETNNHNQ